MSVLIKPIITEKATLGSELHNRYTFLVHPQANKVEIKKAVEAAYGVSVEKVRTLNSGPERKLRYTCLLYTSPSPRDKRQSRMPSSA